MYPRRTSQYTIYSVPVIIIYIRQVAILYVKAMKMTFDLTESLHGVLRRVWSDAQEEQQHKRTNHSQDGALGCVSVCVSNISMYIKVMYNTYM